jgi:hypothetical protein
LGGEEASSIQARSGSQRSPARGKKSRDSLKSAAFCSAPVAAERCSKIAQIQGSKPNSAARALQSPQTPSTTAPCSPVQLRAKLTESIVRLVDRAAASLFAALLASLGVTAAWQGVRIYRQEVAIRAGEKAGGTRVGSAPAFGANAPNVERVSR